MTKDDKSTLAGEALSKVSRTLESLPDIMRQALEESFNPLSDLIETKECVETIARNPKIRVVETDNIRATRLRTGDVQVLVEGEIPKAFTIESGELKRFL